MKSGYIAYIYDGYIPNSIFYKYAIYTDMSKDSLFQASNKVINQPIESEITQSYIDYAMSVIVSRALPDTRDGFKPVLRRIIYTMHEMGLKNSGKYKKSMGIVGQTLRDYHPHGDSSVYEAMVRMAQDFSLRYPLIEGQGNFGSIDGDGAAAARYTEVKLAKIAEEMLHDIEEDTVSRRPNYDNSLQEPVTLPTRFPNHLCNGTMGIAVGMATNMPPHNLTEVIDASLLLINKSNKDNKSSIVEKVPFFEGNGDIRSLREGYPNYTRKVIHAIIKDKNSDKYLWIERKTGDKMMSSVAGGVEEGETDLDACYREIQEETGYTDAEYIRQIYTCHYRCFHPYKDRNDYNICDAYLFEVDMNQEVHISEDEQAKHAPMRLSLSELKNKYIIQPLVTYIDILEGKTPQIDIYIDKINEYTSEYFAYINKNKKDTYIPNELDIYETEFADVSIDDIMDIIQGPDFPTGGMIFDTANIREVYSKGRGSILTRGKTHIENHNGLDHIIIDDIPYQTKKAEIIEKIGQLVTDKKIEGISDIIDESAKNIIRVSIPLKKGTNPQVILTQLYKYTNLQSNFSVNNVTLVNRGSQPQTLNIKDMLIEFVVFRREVVTKRSQYQLSKALDRLHILEGLYRAIDIIDDIIAIIRSSSNTDEAKQRLINQFDFTEIQTEYILRLTLGRLVGLEIQKILDEIADKKSLVEYLQSILADHKKLDEVVSQELIQIRDKYGDARRTIVSDDPGGFAGDFKQLLKLQDNKKEDVICLIDNEYNVKILYQSRIQVIPEDTIHMIKTHNQDKLIVMTDIGELVISRLKDLGSHTIKQNGLNPSKNRNLKGNVILCETMENDYDALCLLTDKNNLKKIDKELLLKFKKFPTTIMNLGKDETIIGIVAVKESDHIGIISQGGYMVMFKSESVRSMGKTAGGVKGIELQDGDQVGGIFKYTDEPFILIYSKDSAKLMMIDDIKIHRRGHKGQVVAVLHPQDRIIGGAAIIEGNIRFKLANEEIKTLHNDDMKLDDPETPLAKITNSAITMVYRPREENLKKKAEEKLEENKADETKSDNGQTGLWN